MECSELADPMGAADPELRNTALPAWSEVALCGKAVRLCGKLVTMLIVTACSGRLSYRAVVGLSVAVLLYTCVREVAVPVHTIKAYGGIE